METKTLLKKEEFLTHWQGHRALTRRVIDAFPEKDLFEFSIGGMRTFALMAQELLAIAVPSLESFVAWQQTKFEENEFQPTTKNELLEKWDQDTDQINALFMKIPENRFYETFNLFGEYNNTVLENLLYFLDNEVHHRGQGYVYLRALGIEPPFFWER